jgi:hypothetical protein
MITSQSTARDCSSSEVNDRSQSTVGVRRSGSHASPLAFGFDAEAGVIKIPEASSPGLHETRAGVAAAIAITFNA